MGDLENILRSILESLSGLPRDFVARSRKGHGRKRRWDLKKPFE